MHFLLTNQECQDTEGCLKAMSDKTVSVNGHDYKQEKHAVSRQRCCCSDDNDGYLYRL